MKPKTNAILLIVLLIVGLLIYCYASTDPELELEIYTKENIYFIKGLEVANERNNIVLHFKSKEDLKEYISQITADENSF